LTKGRGAMFGKRSIGKQRGADRGASENAECAAIREQIMTAIYSDPGAVVEAVSIHLERCDACRVWESDVRRLHLGCRASSVPLDVSRLTSFVLGSRVTDARSAAGDIAGLRLGAKPASDQGVLFVVALAVVLFNLLLALALQGSARVLFPLVGFAVMMAASAWVYVDSTRRKMPAAFWTAVQPFTVPAGLIAYLACRRRPSSRCASCGREAAAGDRFCVACGSALASFCCGCGRSVRKEFRVCPHCGTRLEECFPRDDGAGRTCGWSRAQIAFLAVVNVALLAGFVAALARWGTLGGIVAALVYLFGYFPIFNWVSVDSRRRAMSTILWGVLALVTLYVGLVIYLACRTDVRAACPVCGSYPPVSFNFCPCCGSMLGESCPSCGASSREGRYCAACGAELLSEAASPRSPE
jgi:hypothetical protein